MYKICDRFYITIFENEDETRKMIEKSKQFITSTDYHDSYNSLDKDYGPINISDIINFSNYINTLINFEKTSDRDIVYYTYKSKNNVDLLNLVLLSGCYLIFYKKYTPENVIYDLHNIFNYFPNYYNDCISNFGGYKISIIDCWFSLYHAINIKVININTFDNNDYEYLINYCERDMNIIGNKFLAMTCPSKKIDSVKDELLKRNINLVLRLNGSDKYDTTLFEINKIKVIDLYFQNYSTPSIKLVKKFMNLVNNTEYNKLVAIHCTAGLGRTGLLICIWLIIKLNFTPKNAIAYIRMIRPGSIMGYQGVFLESIEHFRKFI